MVGKGTDRSPVDKTAIDLILDLVGSVDSICLYSFLSMGLQDEPQVKLSFDLL